MRRTWPLSKRQAAPPGRRDGEHGEFSMTRAFKWLRDRQRPGPTRCEDCGRLCRTQSRRRL